MPLDPVQRAEQLGATPISDGDVFSPPSFSEDFVSEQFPYMNGKVSLRFPTFGDDVEIARLSAMDGHTLQAVVFASLAVCIDQAPAAWWRKVPNSDKPVLSLAKLHDTASLVNLFTRWQTWRANFRQEIQGVPTPTR